MFCFRLVFTFSVIFAFCVLHDTFQNFPSNFQTAIPLSVFPLSTTYTNFVGAPSVSSVSDVLPNVVIFVPHDSYIYICSYIFIWFLWNCLNLVVGRWDDLRYANLRIDGREDEIPDPEYPKNEWDTCAVHVQFHALPAPLIFRVFKIFSQFFVFFICFAFYCFACAATSCWQCFQTDLDLDVKTWISPRSEYEVNLWASLVVQTDVCLTCGFVVQVSLACMEAGYGAHTQKCSQRSRFWFDSSCCRCLLD